MKKGLRWLFAALTLFQGGIVPASGAEDPRLVAEINNQAGFDKAVTAGAKEIVSGIFSELGVQIGWQNRADSGSPGAGSGTPAAQPDLLINLVSVRPTVIGGRGDEAGLAAVPGDGQPGVRIWIFRPPLEKIIDDTQYLVPSRDRILLGKVLLAHVMAHEMGHLLLGSTAHSGSGIMTIGWHLSKIQLACTGRLRFLPRQSEGIRAAARARNAAVYASAGRPVR